jgi:hypothetical protein
MVNMLTPYAQSVFSHYAGVVRNMSLGDYALDYSDADGWFEIIDMLAQCTSFTITIEEVSTAELANDGVQLDRGMKRKAAVTCFELTAHTQTAGTRTSPPEPVDTRLARVPFREMERSFWAILHEWLKALIADELERVRESVPQPEEIE